MPLLKNVASQNVTFNMVSADDKWGIRRLADDPQDWREMARHIHP